MAVAYKADSMWVTFDNADALTVDITRFVRFIFWRARRLSLILACALSSSSSNVEISPVQYRQRQECGSTTYHVSSARRALRCHHNACAVSQ